MNSKNVKSIILCSIFISVLIALIGTFSHYTLVSSAVKQPVTTVKPVTTRATVHTSAPVKTTKVTNKETTDTKEGSYQYSGDITVYAPRPNGGNCGYPQFSKAAQDFFVAIPKSMYQNSLNCGRCIEATCTAGNVGTNCDNGETTIMMVTDSCPECHEGDLDLSYAAWNKITGNAGFSRFKADWKYIDCPKDFLITPTFNFYIKVYLKCFLHSLTMLLSLAVVDGGLL